MYQLECLFFIFRNCITFSKAWPLCLTWLDLKLIFEVYLKTKWASIVHKTEDNGNMQSKFNFIGCNVIRIALYVHQLNVYIFFYKLGVKIKNIEYSSSFSFILLLLIYTSKLIYWCWYWLDSDGKTMIIKNINEWGKILFVTTKLTSCIILKNWSFDLWFLINVILVMISPFWIQNNTFEIQGIN